MSNPERKSLLNKYIKAVQAIIYDAGRMRQLAPMLDTRDGSVKAVASILGVIEQKKPIPSDVKSLLAVNAYILMVDMLQEVQGQKPDVQIVHQTILAILKQFAPTNQTQGVPTMPAAQPSAGLINGVAA